MDQFWHGNDQIFDTQLRYFEPRQLFYRQESPRSGHRSWRKNHDWQF